MSVDVEGSNIQCSCCSERNVCLSVIEPLTVSFELYSCQVCVHLADTHVHVKWPVTVDSDSPSYVMAVCYVCVQFEKIEAVNDEESFVLLTDVHSLTSCPLKILSSRLLLVRTSLNT